MQSYINQSVYTEQYKNEVKNSMGESDFFCKQK